MFHAAKSWEGMSKSTSVTNLSPCIFFCSEKTWKIDPQSPTQGHHLLSVKPRTLGMPGDFVALQLPYKTIFKYQSHNAMCISWIYSPHLSKILWILTIFLLNTLWVTDLWNCQHKIHRSYLEGNKKTFYSGAKYE